MSIDGWFCLVTGAALFYLTLRPEPKLSSQNMTFAWQLFIGAIFVQAAGVFLAMIFFLNSSHKGAAAVNNIASAGTLALIAMILLTLVRGFYPAGGSPAPEKEST